MPLAFDTIVESSPDTWTIETAGSGPSGRLPLTAEMLREQPSGDIFGLTQNAGMGWDPARAAAPAVPHPQHPGRHPRAPTAGRSPSAITPATGRSAS